VHCDFPHLYLNRPLIQGLQSLQKFLRSSGLRCRNSQSRISRRDHAVLMMRLMMESLLMGLESKGRGRVVFDDE
jgi:hypothetical protein